MESHDYNPIDDAIARRLRRLGSMPMDLSALKARIDAERKPVAPPTVWARLLRPASGLAAGVLVLILVGAIVLSGSPSAAMAQQMAQHHRDLVAGRIAVTKVDSIDAAARVLAEADPDLPALPAPPDAHVMACCMKDVRNKRVAHVLLETDGSPITMAVAAAKDMKPMGRVLKQNGVSYHVVSYDSLNMISCEKAGRWVCLIGELPIERLMTIAEKLQF